MTLLQDTLNDIELCATRETQNAMRHAGEIDELESITQRLNDTKKGVEFSPLVTTYNHCDGVSVRAYITHECSISRVREAITTAGLFIDSEEIVEGQTSTPPAVKLMLNGTSVFVQIAHPVADVIEMVA